MINHNVYSNVTDPYDNYNPSLSEKTLHEIQMQLMNKQELRLRYIKLMSDAHDILGKEEAIQLIKESEKIWEKLSA